MSAPIIVVQCTASDLLTSSYQGKQAGDLAGEDPYSYAVGPLRDAGIAPVVLAAPDIAENREVIPELADGWGILAHLGEEHDLIARLLGAAAAHDADVVARVVMPSFYVEPDIVRAQLAHLDSSGADYCTVARDFNINFAADIVRTSALVTFNATVESLPEALRGTARYRPWPFLEASDDRIRVTHFDALPEITADRVASIRSQRNWPERSGPGFEGGEYHALAADFVRSEDVVLDAGCGHGEISGILAQYAAHVTGVDYDADMIELARARFPECQFEAADLQQWRRPAAFDVIFHCHTLEHVPDPVGTLRNLVASLKPDGRLIVEVPLQLRPGVINPHHQREYTVDSLMAQIAEAALGVVGTRGVNRGIYGPPETAREAFVAVCNREVRHERP